MMIFTWDRTKEIKNVRKHGVSFIEAQTCFLDPNARIISDPDHSLEEERFVLMGMSIKFRILVVPHTYEEDSETIRIISARKAIKGEIDQYRGWKK
ncbi:MAG: BrnT family toxin [Planctomycetota bacterium]|jgi:uncharacterized DUF497 family protein